MSAAQAAGKCPALAGQYDCAKKESPSTNCPLTIEQELKDKFDQFRIPVLHKDTLFLANSKKVGEDNDYTLASCLIGSNRKTSNTFFTCMKK